MGILKALLKLTVLALVGTAVTAVVALVRRSPAATPVSYDEWPAVPTKPTASPTN